ncbi:MAG TPA: YeeE/YedE thiosulfate transporter family protein [Rhodanobacteraceae bacterium]
MNINTITTFTPIAGLLGGIMIGIATVAWLWLYGRVTGISGTIHTAVFKAGAGDRAWRWFYLAGLVVGALIYTRVLVPGGLPGPHFAVQLQVSWPLLLLAGLLVGFGTRMANGCTSGHGVCGIARLSRRSIVATATFVAFGFVATFLARHVFGL